MTTSINNYLFNRAIKAEKRLADMVKVADMIEAMCDDEIAKLKARIDELESELYWINESEAQVDEDAAAREALRLQEYDRASEYAEMDYRLYGIC